MRRKEGNMKWVVLNQGESMHTEQICQVIGQVMTSLPMMPIQAMDGVGELSIVASQCFFDDPGR